MNPGAAHHSRTRCWRGICRDARNEMMFWPNDVPPPSRCSLKCTRTLPEVTCFQLLNLLSHGSMWRTRCRFQKFATAVPPQRLGAFRPINVESLEDRGAPYHAVTG